METMMMEIITIEKFSLTTGMLPKKYPAKEQVKTQTIPPKML